MSNLQHKRIEKKRYLVRNNERQKKLYYLENLINEREILVDIDKILFDIIKKFIKKLPYELIEKIYMIIMCKYHDQHILDSTAINCICCNKHIEYLCHNINIVIEPNNNINQMVGFMKQVPRKNIFLCSQLLPKKQLGIDELWFDQEKIYHEITDEIKKKYKLRYIGPLYCGDNCLLNESYVFISEQIKF